MECDLLVSFLQHFYTFQGNALVINKEDRNISVKFSGQLLPYTMITKMGAHLSEIEYIYTLLKASTC